MNAEQWTNPYFGVQHLGGLTDKYRASICDHGKFCLLHKWYPGCGFSPIEELHDNVTAAKSSGENWLKAKG